MTVEIEPRGDYLHVVLRGALPTSDDAKQLTSLLRHAIDRLKIHRCLVSGRELDRQPPQDAWNVVWTWLGQRTCRQLAWVVAPGTGELTVTTLNMAAMTDSLAFRAFPMVLDAARWLELRSTASGSLRRQSSAELGDVRESGERAQQSSSHRLARVELVTQVLPVSALDEPESGSALPPAVTGSDPLRESGKVVRPKVPVDPRVDTEEPLKTGSDEEVRSPRRITPR